MRWILRGIGALAVLAFLAVVTLLLIPSDRIARLAEAQVEAATGRGFTVEGSVRPSLWPSPGVSLTGVRLAAADWAEAGPLLQAEGLEISVGWSALWGGPLRITGLVLRKPQLTLETDAGGRRSWDTGDSAGGGAGKDDGDAVPDVAVDVARIEGGVLRWVDRGAGQVLRVEAVNAALSMPALQGPAEFAGSGRVNGQALRLEGSIAGVAELLTDAAVPVQVQANLGGATLGFDGSAGLSPTAAEGDVTADLSQRGGLFAMLGQAAPGLPAGLGREAMSLSGRLTYAQDRLALRRATLVLDGNRLEVEADIAPGDRAPLLTAQLRTQRLDLSALAPEAEAPATDETAGWSEAPLDLSALDLVDGRVSFAAQEVLLGKARLGAVEAVTTLERARAVTDLRRVEAYGGRLTGQAVVNARDGLSASLALSLEDLLLQPLLTDLAGQDRLATTAAASLDLRTAGDSLAAMMQGLGGEVSLRTGAGEILGLDLAGMLLRMDAGYRGEGAKTIFSRIEATGRIENGVLRNEDFAMGGPVVSASGAGRIDLAARTLDYTLVPRLLAGDRAGLEIPLRLTGPWDDPVVHLAVEERVQQVLEREKDRAVDRAEDSLQRRALEELGLEAPEPGESARDAIGKALEKRALDGLRDLLGR